MSESAIQRAARLLSMSNAQLVMHAQDLTAERDDLQRELAQVKAAMKAQAEAMARRRHELIDMRDLLGKTLMLAAVCLEPNTSSATARQIDRALSAWKHMKGGE